MSDKKRVCEPIGEITTVGQMRKVLEAYADETHFGFLNQPAQILFNYESDGIKAVVFQPTETFENDKLSKDGWIKIKDDHSNIPFGDDDALFEVYSPLWDASNYGGVSCYRVSVMTSAGRGSVTHFRPIA